MGRSLALGLYLLLAKLGSEDEVLQRPPRGAGRLLWIHVAQGESARAVVQLLREQDPSLLLLTTTESGAAPDFDSDHVDALPSDRQAAVRAFLDHWRPDAGLFIGKSLPAVPIAEAHDRQIPMILADIRIGPDEMPFWLRGLTGSVLGRFSRIFARDAETVQTLRTLGGRALPVELGGRIEGAIEPLDCVEAEREALAHLLSARPVWFAAACPEEEEAAIISAHEHAMQHAHRLLLILAPVDTARAAGLARDLTSRGFVVAERAADQEPSRDVQVLITDGPTEFGLWYRLAPVTYLGGTLSGRSTARDPFEAATLGSAIVHGPEIADRMAAYQRLSDARALCAVANADELAAAIADLIAPDRAAVLAHNAWAATSGSAEVAERLVQVVLGSLAAEKPVS